MKTLRILIADDHDIVREGVRTLLAPHKDWQVCGEAVTGRQALHLAKQLKPDVVVLDFSLPEVNGLEVTRQIHKELPQTEVLILTMHESETLAREVFAAGARAFVVKTNSKCQLVPAVEALARHEPFLTSALSALALDGFLYPEGRPMDVRDAHVRLTSREREIIQLIAQGQSSKEIATALAVSVKTVDAHRANIMRKVNVHSASQLVLFAVRNRIVQI
jgi:DNA-binding NarL/FixJ family response regulator